MNKLVVVFGLFGLTFFFGVGVTAVQLVTDSFLFPFDSGGGFEVDDLLDFNDSNNATTKQRLETDVSVWQTVHAPLTIEKVLPFTNFLKAIQGFEKTYQKEIMPKLMDEI